MRKKVFGFMMSVLFIICMSGLALAGNTATVTQTSLDNDAIVYQNGSGNIIDSTQDEDLSNYLNASQTGIDNEIDIMQNAPGKDNAAYIDQSGDGNDIAIEQVATTGYNYIGGKGSITWGPDLNQTGDNNEVAVYQWGTEQQVEIDQLGSGNQIINTVQISTNDYNYLGVYTAGNLNTVEVYMDSTEINEAYIWQYGNENVVDVQTYAGGGYSLIGGNVTYPLEDGIVQRGNYNLVQTNQDAGTYNDMQVRQMGDDNALVGLGINSAMIQYSLFDHNRLVASQLGGGNHIGLEQDADGCNDADIYQSGGLNSVEAYQSAGTYNDLDVVQNGNATLVSDQTASGFNDLFVSQSAGSSATVTQIATSGNNVAIITQ